MEPRGVDAVFVLQFVVYIPLACVGVCGNGLSFWVWLGEAKKSSTTLLFMYLAVSDNAQLICIATRKVLAVVNVVSEGSEVFSHIMMVVGELGVVLSAYTTTLIAFKRWYSVWKPLHVNTFLSGRRVFIMCVVTSLWSAVLVVPQNVTHFLWESMSQQEERAATITPIVLGRIVPTLLLVICSVSMVWMLARQSRQFQQRRTSFTESTAAAAQRRVTVGVLCIAACTFITFPIGFTATLILGFEESTFSTCDMDCYMITLEIVNILLAINSSINFVFYLAFSSTFQKLMKPRMSCVWRLLGVSGLDLPSKEQQAVSGTGLSLLPSSNSDTP